MNYQAIKFDVSDGQGRLTFNRPEKLNASDVLHSTWCG